MKMLAIQRGFSLIEVLVALMLFAVVVAVMTPSFIMHVRTNNFAEVKSDALAAAQRVLDELRTSSISSMPASGSSSPQIVSVNGKNFSVTIQYCNNPSLCDATTRHLTAKVVYQNQTLQNIETVFTALRAGGA